MHIAYLQMWYFLQAEMFSWLLFKIVLHVKVLSIKINLFILLIAVAIKENPGVFKFSFFFHSEQQERGRI